MNSYSSSENLPTAGLLRRLAAMVYDALLLFAALLLAAFPFLMIVGDPLAGGAPRLVFQIYLLAIVFLFFFWFWTHGGQTLGMRAWRLRLVTLSGHRLSWQHASIRFAAALLSAGALGLGYVGAAFRRDRLTWHDRLSGTRPVVLPKTGKKT